MFGVYDIIETVGQGGMGVVYRAHDTALDRIVALKVLKEDLRQNKQVAARFQREAEAIASLNHPNITHIYSVGAVGRIPYIAMEFIEGATLSGAMKRVKSFPWKRALHIAEQVAEALACAHDSHIIHRDIKPGNIMLGANDHAYVTDFGIAKVLTAETQLTVEGSRLGTPHYMSPERCSKADITPSSDLYSLGVVLFQMLSGRLPYEANSPVDLVRKIVAEPPARLSEFVQDVPEDVERLVAYLIEKKPANRPTNAAAVAEMCRRVIEGEPLFEEGTVASSLREYRDNNPTPSTTTTTHIDSALAEAGLAGRAAALWAGIPLSARLWMGGACLIAAMATAGQWTARRSFGNYALSTVAQWDRSLAGWTETSTVAEISAESDGVALAQCNFQGFTLGAMTQVGAAGFAIELRDPFGGPAAILAVHPETASVRVGLPPAAFGNDSAVHLLAGAKSRENADGPEEPYFFMADTRAHADESGPVLLRGDALLLNSSYGRVAASTESLRKAIGGRVLDIRSAALRADATEAALCVRAESGKGDQLVRVQLAEVSPSEIEPLLLDTLEITAMAYNAYGDLNIAQKSGGAWKVIQIPAGESGSQAAPLAEFSGPNLSVLRFTSGGALTRSNSANNAQTLAWRDLASGDTWDLGEGTDAALADGGDFAVIAAPDRRGNMQLWLLRRDAPSERRQLTYLADGIGSGLELSRDGRYAIAGARPGKLPTLVSVDINAAVRE